MEIIYILDPINGTAKIVTSQKGCSDTMFIDIGDIPPILARLKEERVELKNSLGIKNYSQLKNRMYYRTNIKQNYVSDKIKFQRLLETGLQIKTFQDILSKMKKTDR